MLVSLSSGVLDKGSMKIFGKVACQYIDGLGSTKLKMNLFF